MHKILSPFYYAWRLRRAWWFTATARTRARFARTKLGSFWLGFSNLLSISVLATVYGTVFKVQDFSSYAVFLGTGLVIWNSMSGAIVSSNQIFIYNADNLRNTNLNPIYYLAEEWAFQIQTFSQSFILVLLGLSFFQPNLFLNLIIAAWFPLLNLILFIYWFPLLVCLLGSWFRDIYQLIPIVMQLLFLLSPILYQKKNLGNLSWIVNFNPLYRVLSPLRHALMHGELQLSQTLTVLLINIIGIILATYLLNKQRPYLPFLY